MEKLLELVMLCIVKKVVKGNCVSNRLFFSTDKYLYFYSCLYLCCLLPVFFSGSTVVYSLYITSKHEGPGFRPAEICFFQDFCGFSPGADFNLPIKILIFR